ncbi:MAG: hypothetical protein WAN95_03655 [Bacteroidales bacterium]
MKRNTSANSKALHNGGVETDIIVCGFYVTLSWLDRVVFKNPPLRQAPNH